MCNIDDERRFGQFSLGSMLVFTALAAIYLSVAKCCGHLSAVITAVALTLLILARTGKWFKARARARIMTRLLAGCMLWFALCDRVEKTYYCPECERAVVTQAYRVVGIALASRELVSRTIDGKMVVKTSCPHSDRELEHEIRYWGLAIPEWHIHSQPGMELTKTWDSGSGAKNEFASLERLHEIGYALAQYEAANGSYPPQYVADKDGRPMHSWRVLLLPYLGYDDLFKQYDMKQPWNSPKNRALASQIPSTYDSPYDRTRRCPITPYLAVSGEETLWPGAGTVKRSDIRGDPSKRIALVEAANSDIEWTEPRDIPFSKASLGILRQRRSGHSELPGATNPSSLGKRRPRLAAGGRVYRPPEGPLDDHSKPANRACM